MPLGNNKKCPLSSMWFDSPAANESAPRLVRPELVDGSPPADPLFDKLNTIRETPTIKEVRCQT